MKLLTFRRRGENIPRIGALNRQGEIVDLHAAYASYLHERGESHPTQRATSQIPMEMIEFIQGDRASLKAAEIAITYAEARKKKGTLPERKRGKSALGSCGFSGRLF
jgi:hypothetical protein